MWSKTVAWRKRKIMTEENNLKVSPWRMNWINLARRQSVSGAWRVINQNPSSPLNNEPLINGRNKWNDEQVSSPNYDNIEWIRKPINIHHQHTANILAMKGRKSLCWCLPGLCNCCWCSSWVINYRVFMARPGSNLAAGAAQPGRWLFLLCFCSSCLSALGWNSLSFLLASCSGQASIN